MTEHGRPYRQLSSTDARRALYVDFEGGQDRQPVLLGTLRRGRGADPFVHQVVLDPAFAPTRTEVREFRGAVEAVVVRAEHADRRIVAWSQHELDVVREHCADDPALVARFESRYVNALAVAKHWTARCCPEQRPEDRTLGAYLAFIGYDAPPDAERGHVGDTIRALRPTLEAGRPLTSNQRLRWIRLLTHNQHDCAGMRAVCLRATRELEAHEDERR
jgi:hypothetical protein